MVKTPYVIIYFVYKICLSFCEVGRFFEHSVVSESEKTLINCI